MYVQCRYVILLYVDLILCLRFILTCVYKKFVPDNKSILTASSLNKEYRIS